MLMPLTDSTRHKDSTGINIFLDSFAFQMTENGQNQGMITVSNINGITLSILVTNQFT